MNIQTASLYLESIYKQYDKLRGFGDKTGAVYENIIESLYSLLLNPGDGAVDLGACVGLHTLPMATCVGPTGRVLAFEPIPTCRNFIIERATKAQLSRQIEFHDCAVSNVRGTAKFFEMTGAITGHSGLRKKPTYPDGAMPREIQVTTRRLDEFMPTTHRIAFIKADLEGGEFHALQGGREMLAKHRPVVVMESSLNWDATLFAFSTAEFFSFFQSLSYGLKDILGCPFHPSAASRPYPHYLVAYPLEQAAEVGDMLTVAVLRNTVGPAWFNLP